MKMSEWFKISFGMIFILIICFIMQIKIYYWEKEKERMFWFKEKKEMKSEISEDDDPIVNQLKASKELKDYLKTLPFDSYDKESLIKVVTRELEYIEYSIVKKLGQKELNKMKEKQTMVEK